MGGDVSKYKIYISLFQTSSRKIGDCWEGMSQNIKNIFLCFRQAQKIENIYFFVSDKLKEDWRLLGGEVSKYKIYISLSQNRLLGKYIKYIFLFLCFRQAQGRLEIVGRGKYKIYISLSQNIKYIYLCFRQAQGRLEIGDCWEGDVSKYKIYISRQAQGRLEIVGRRSLKI